MDKLEELLPGIEDFLLRILPHEKLSRAAEERRQYFAERLDILKLPPSLPPRIGKRISLELLHETEISSGTPASELVVEAVAGEEDFAAYQRRISRNLLGSPSTETLDEIESDSEKGVKLYDDIEPTEGAKIKHPKAEDDDDEDDEINALYEIPVSRESNPLTPHTEDSISQPADISSLATTGSVNDISDDILDGSVPSSQKPPLPPRKESQEKKVSESDCRTNTNEGKPPELPFRPPLPRRSEIHTRSEKSDKSEKSEKSDQSDGDSTSYESFEEQQDQGRETNSPKLNIMLPKRPIKKLTKTSKLLANNKNKSASSWEINVPFKKLENVILSGELYHRGKLSWNRRLVAIRNNSMALYKPDKEGKPVFVIPLSGYEAMIGERDGRKGFEIRLAHQSGDTHVFAVDFKEWAALWCEHINNIAKGVPVTAFHQHLARTFSGSSENSADGNKGNLSSSNLSINSDGVESDDSAKPRLRGNKVMRMGSFAYRATQFFENIGKKTSSKVTSKSLSKSSIKRQTFNDEIQEESSSSASLEVPISPSSDTTSPVFEDRNLLSSTSTPTSSEPHKMPSFPLPPVPSSFKIQGYLNIFSSFNRRRWGLRWCLVRENMFECYRSKTSQPCELNFLLKNCIIRHAHLETKSPLTIMLLENNKEKITVEPQSKEDMSQWLTVLMEETSTECVPEGLEEYFVESEDIPGDLQVPEAEYSDILGTSAIKSWELGRLSIFRNQESETSNNALIAVSSAASEDLEMDLTKDSVTDISSQVKDLYTEVIKRSTLVSTDDEEIDTILNNNSVDRRNEENVNFMNNLSVDSANKHTTDSGFYSVREVSSDSNDSDIESTQEDSFPTWESTLLNRHENTVLKRHDNISGKGISNLDLTNGKSRTSEEEDDESLLERTMTAEDFQVNIEGGEVMHNNFSGDIFSHLDIVNSDSCNECGKVTMGSSSFDFPKIEVKVNSDKSEGDITGTDLSLADASQNKSHQKLKKKKPKKKPRGPFLHEKQEDESKESELPSLSTAENVLSPATVGKSILDSQKLRSIVDSSKSTPSPRTGQNDGTNCPVGVNPDDSETKSEPVKTVSSHTRTESSKPTDSYVKSPDQVASVSLEGKMTDISPEGQEVVELRERIFRLREKLVQIKRKRIAVRDKRVRAFSAEERTVCDKEYLALDQECKDIAATIQNFEQELERRVSPQTQCKT